MNSAHPLAASARIVGTVVNRKEDPRLLTGDSRYVDDVVVPGIVHAHFVRSDVARGPIVRIDAAAARAATGVIAVLTAAELNPLQQGPMRATPMLGMPGAAPERPLADGDVKFVGDPVALVVAESRALAEDAAELVELDIDPLPPVVDFETAADSRELVHDGERDSNVFSHLEVAGGDDLEAVFAGAPHVIDQTLMINPAVVHGQIDGGAVQGIGGALLEEFVYDEAGNPLTTTFLDYLIPTAADVPSSSTATSRPRRRRPATTRASAKGARSAHRPRSRTR